MADDEEVDDVEDDSSLPLSLDPHAAVKLSAMAAAATPATKGVRRVLRSVFMLGSSPVFEAYTCDASSTHFERG